MTTKECLIQEIINTPEDLIEELMDFLLFIRSRRAGNGVSNGTSSIDSVDSMDHPVDLPRRRVPPATIAGKGKTLGDMVSPIVDEEDWECLK